MPIPVELQDAPQWLVWKYEERHGKRTKVPYCVATGERASTTDAASWTVYEAAAACGRRPGVDGIGFVFSKTDDFVGVDLDDCRDPDTGAVADWAREIVNLLNSYTEITPSGRGLHVLCHGRLPPGGRRKGKVEIYEDGRYFTITGAALPGLPLRLEQRTEQLAALHGRIFPAEPATAPKPNGARGAAPDQWAIVERVLQHPKEAALWRGSTAGYESQSEAELALVGLIAFYAGPDPALVDRIYRLCDLSRDKWDSPRPGGTYGSITVAKALSTKGPGDFYDWTAADKKASSVVSVVRETPPKEASVVSVVRENLVKKPKMPEMLEPEAYQGLPGRVMKTIAPHTEGHPAGILASFLTAGGCLIGPRPHVTRDAQPHACNEFGLLVGPTASGKGTASRRVDEIFKYSGCLESIINDGNDERGCTGGGEPDMAPDLGFKDLILRGLGSGEALVRGLSEEQADGGIESRRLVFESEFARCLKVMQREGSTLSDVLKNAWDSEPMHSRTKGETIKADNAHVSILAHVTEKDLRARLSDTDLFNGFANRFLWFNVSRVGLLPFGGGRAPLAPIVSSVHAALNYARAWLGQMEFDADSKRIWAEFGIYARLRDPAPGLLGPLTDRGPSHVTRIALQYAVWDLATEIRVPHLLAGLAVWDYSFRTLEGIFGRSTGDPNADLIVENLVERDGGYLTRQELRDLFARNAKPGEIPTALDLLTEMGIIRREKHATGGRAAEIVVLTQENPYDRNDERPLNVARKAAAALGYTTETT